MAVVYKHLRQVKNSTSGLADTILIAQKDWFETIACADPNAATATLDTATLIAENHVFKAGFGFIEIQCAPFKNKLDGATIGEVGSSSFDNTISAMVPGSHEALHETIRQFKNQSLIALVRDGNCSEERYYQLGCDCKGAWMAASFSTGEGKGGQKGYNITLSVEQEAVITYGGTITMFPEV